MKQSTVIKQLLGAGGIAALCVEFGVCRLCFDSRSTVEDGVVGADYWIIAVDGKPTERVPHGVLVTRIPYALLEPGKRVMRLSTAADPPASSELIEFRATIVKGVDYRISRNGNGDPELVAKP